MRLLLLVLRQALLVPGRLLWRRCQPVKLLLLLLLLQHTPQLAAGRDVCLTGQQQLQLTSRLPIIAISHFQLPSQLVSCCRCCCQFS